jgi:U2 small nuclear ribonucleoprotein B''
MIAFVEYLDESQASVAKQALHGYRLIPEEEIRVSYARK